MKVSLVHKVKVCWVDKMEGVYEGGNGELVYKGGFFFWHETNSPPATISVPKSRNVIFFMLTSRRIRILALNLFKICSKLRFIHYFTHIMIAVLKSRKDLYKDLLNDSIADKVIHQKRWGSKLMSFNPENFSSSDVFDTIIDKKTFRRRTVCIL